MLNTLYKKIIVSAAAVAAAGVGGTLLLSDAFDIGRDSSGVSVDGAEAQSSAGAEPWRGKLVQTQCPAFESKDVPRMLLGNWFASWNGVPNKRFNSRGQYLDSAHLTIQFDGTEGEFTVFGPSWFRDGTESVIELPAKTAQVNPIKLESVQGGVVQTSLAYYLAPESTLPLNPDSPDRISGNWEIRDDWPAKEKIRGSVTWDRAIPVITGIVIRSEQDVDSLATADTNPSADFCGARTVRTSQLPVATLNYSEKEWSDRFNKLRANRPTFYMDIYGENFWGRHDTYFDHPNTGLEAMAATQIRDPDGSGKVIGLRVRFNIWYDVQPGWYTLYLDDFAIPFQLDIPNFYPSVELKYVNYDPVNDTERQLSEIPINQTFWVHASVKNPERFDDTAPLIVHWRGMEFSAPAKKLRDSEYRAGPFVVSDNLLPSSVAPANDPCKKDQRSGG